MPRPKKSHSLSHKDRRKINLLVTQGKYQKAAKIFKRSLPISGVVNELRQMSSDRARAAHLAGNWQAVVMHLEAYSTLAKQYRTACLVNDNQEPPDHEPEDQALLDQARAHVR